MLIRLDADEMETAPFRNNVPSEMSKPKNEKLACRPDGKAAPGVCITQGKPNRCGRSVRQCACLMSNKKLLCPRMDRVRHPSKVARKTTKTVNNNGDDVQKGKLSKNKSIAKSAGLDWNGCNSKACYSAKSNKV